MHVYRNTNKQLAKNFINVTHSPRMKVDDTVIAGFVVVGSGHTGSTYRASFRNIEFFFQLLVNCGDTRNI